MEKPYLDTVIELIPRGASLLDLGCGNGKPIMEYFLQSGFIVTGVDASEKMLALAKQNFQKKNFSCKI